MGQKEFRQIYPQPGYVEHDAVQILQTTLYAMRQAVQSAGITAADIAAISITNQRETTVAWDADTGIPICNAIVWQCRRTGPAAGGGSRPSTGGGCQTAWSGRHCSRQ